MFNIVVAMMVDRYFIHGFLSSWDERVSGSVCLHEKAELTRKKRLKLKLVKFITIF